LREKKSETSELPMTKKSKDALLRSDRVLVGALAVVLAAASAAVGAAASTHPYTDKSSAAIVQAAPAPVMPTALARKGNSADAVMQQLLAEHRCLSEVMYYEARGEGMPGEKAVAEVVFHRMRTGNYGHSICAVVYEGAGRAGCQFSFVCNNEMAQRKAPGAWREAEVLAARILTGEVRLGDTTAGATHFHAVSVSPGWAGDMESTVQIGNHIFYKNGRSRSL
jgi:spore germination cell wall hydrolase CwlJ-like protein